MAAFRRVLGEEGIGLDEEEYFARYLGLCDRDIARDVLRRRGGEGGDADRLAAMVDHLLARKALAYRDLVRRHIPEVAGATAFIQAISAKCPIAVASGALRVEVEDGLYRLGVRDRVTAVVTIEDVSRGKPHPETFVRAREVLIRICTSEGAPLPLLPDEPSASVLVIEDSPAGLAAARVLPDLTELTSADIEQL